MDIREVILRRMRHSTESDAVEDAGSGSSNDQASDRKRSLPTADRGGWMTEPEEPRWIERSTEEPVEESHQMREAPIDQDVAGELNAALPEEQPTAGEDAQGERR